MFSKQQYKELSNNFKTISESLDDGELLTFDFIINQLSGMLKQDNPKFNRTRFEVDCGLASPF